MTLIVLGLWGFCGARRVTKIGIAVRCLISRLTPGEFYMYLQPCTWGSLQVFVVRCAFAEKVCFPDRGSLVAAPAPLPSKTSRIRFT